MNREPLSVVVTTLDNGATLERCLASARFADEIVVLDSGSTDATRDIAAAHGARWFVEPFKGYGPQKQSAIDKATHRWVLLLDADECVPEACRAAIEAVLLAPDCEGYEIPRREQVFWRMQHEAAHHNPMLRLFDRKRVRMSDDGIHAQPLVDGRRRAAGRVLRTLRRTRHRDQGRQDQPLFGRGISGQARARRALRLAAAVRAAAADVLQVLRAAPAVPVRQRRLHRQRDRRLPRIPEVRQGDRAAQAAVATRGGAATVQPSMLGSTKAAPSPRPCFV